MVGFRMRMYKRWKARVREDAETKLFHYTMQRERLEVTTG
jgi:hypothetical protein